MSQITLAQALRAVVVALGAMSALPAAAVEPPKPRATTLAPEQTAAVPADGPRFRDGSRVVSLQRGQQLFIEHCALCHGMTGRGDGPRSAYFQAGAQFIPDFAAPGYLAGRDAQVLQSLREGLKRLPEPAIVMPQFKYILSEGEIRGVLAYVHTLARKAEPAPGLYKVAASHDGETLAKKHNCLACHQSGAKVVGPAYRDVAAKYRSQPDAASLLAERIRSGGSGVWGPLSMPPMPNVTEPERLALARWILATP
ncbi:MAG: c-type cytochrome [Rubrivivax sp.]